MKIFNVETPTTPNLIGSIDTNEGITSMVIEDDLIYAVTDLSNAASVENPGSYLSIISIADPALPVLLGSVNITGDASFLSVNGNYIYVAVGDTGMNVIDISVPETPIHISTLLLDNATYITTTNNKAYLTGKNGLLIVDIANPNSPELLSSSDFLLNSGINKAPKEVYIKGDIAYAIAAYSVGVINISNAAEPFLVGELFTGTTNHSMFLKDDLAYIAQKQGVTIVDTSLITATELNNALFDINTTALKLKNNELRAINHTIDETTFKTIDITIPNQPNIKGEYKFNPFSQVPYDKPMPSWSIQGNTAYLSTSLLSEDGISLVGTTEIIDLSQSSDPLLLGTFEIDTLIDSIVVKDNIAYVIGEDLYTNTIDFKVFDVANPFEPKLLGAITSISPGSYNSATNDDEIFIKDNIAYVSGFSPNGSLKIIDISNASAPLLLAQLDNTIGNIKAIDNNIAYLVSSNELKLVDVKNPEIPVQITSVSPLVSSVSIKNDVAYTTGGVISIWDISNPLLPVITKTISTIGYTTDSVINGENIYIANSNGLILTETNTLDKKIIEVNEDYGSVQRDTELSYSASWATDQPIKVECIVSAGSCVATVNKTEKTAEIIWTTPSVANDYEIVIYGGNTSILHAIRDRVTVE